MSKTIKRQLSLALAFVLLVTLTAFITPMAQAAMGSLTVTLTPAHGQLILDAQTADPGYAFYFSTTAADDTANAPAFESTDLTGWTLYSAKANIAGLNGVELFVQVIKVNTADSKIVAWGQASATPVAITDAVDSGLTGIGSATIYHIQSLFEAAPGLGAEYAIQRVTSRTDPTLTAGYYPQSRSLVTIKVGIESAQSSVPVGNLTPQNDDKYFLIGGSPDKNNSQPSVDGQVFRQTPAFEVLFDDCGGSLAYNPDSTIGFRYGCRNGGVKNAMVNLYNFNTYVLAGIDVTLKSDVQYATGDTISLANIDTVTGYFVSQADATKKLFGQLDPSMVTSIKVLHPDGTEGTTYQGRDDLLMVTVTDANLHTTFPALLGIPAQNIKSSGRVKTDPPINTQPGGSTPIIPPSTAPGAATGTTTAPISIIVDDKEYKIGKLTVDKDASTSVITADEKELLKQIEAATANVTVNVPAETKTVEVDLSGTVIRDLTAKDMSLTVHSGNVQYVLPSDALSAQSILASTGAPDIQSVSFRVIISTGIDAQTVTDAETAVEAFGGSVVIPPISFSIQAVYKDKVVTLDVFNTFVSRTIEMTEEQAKRVTTAVVYEDDGTVRHIPTVVFQEDGNGFVTINSMTNSVYVLIYNDQKFADTEGKWYEPTVNEMASRKIFNGVGDNNFDGDRDITRAEFASIIVKALGLPPSAGSSTFADVPASAWYSRNVETAFAYKLLTGVGSGKFAPEAGITRQEAMLMLANAAKIANYTGNEGELDSFSDASDVSDWAADAIKFCVGSGIVEGSDGMLKPTATITRAESAAIILRLLREAELVDVRGA